LRGLYRFEKERLAVLRKHHRAGEKGFVDFCHGLTLPISAMI